nr:Ig-like domain-containing protein [Candidatus Hamiltonella defensa]
MASQTPKFNLLDIEDDVKHILLQVYKGDHKTLVETIKFDIKDLGDTDKTKNIEEKGIKRTDSGYTYQPSEWEDKTKYKISLTVTDRAKNSNKTNPAAFEVNIDTAIAKIPSITLPESDNQASDKIKKFITQNQTPSFQLDNIDDRAKTITITIYKPGNTTEILASHTFAQETRTFNVNQLILTDTDTDKSELSSLADGQYTIQAKVTLNTKVSSTSGTLVFTVDHADAPTPTIELVGNTGTNEKPVTNKTTPKFKIKGIALDRLDWDNHDSIVVTFQKKNTKEPVTQQITNSDIQKDNNAVEFTANQLEQGEYTVTAKVTYQAGQVGSGQLSDGMTIYTTPPESTIEFVETLDKVGDVFKVRQDQMKFDITINDFSKIPIPNKEGQFKVSVHLTDEQGRDIKEEATQNPTNGSIWTADFTKKTLSAKTYTVKATVTDPHGNDGNSSNQLEVSVIDKLMLPEIQMVEKDNTPYEGAKKKGEATTHNNSPKINISNIDAAANKVTVKLKKLDGKNSETVKTITKKEGKFNLSDLNGIDLSLNENGDYTVTVEASNNDIKSSSELTVKFYGTVLTPKISLIDESVENGKSVLSESQKPSFKIKHVDPHAREINITATPIKPTGKQAQKFKAVLNQNGSIKTNSDNGVFEKIEGDSSYKFTPNEGWNEGKYNIVVSVINEANKESLNSSPLELIISTSELQKVDIALHDDDKTGDKGSNFTKNKNPILIFRTQEDNIDSIEIFKKVEGGDNEKIHTLESTGGFEPNKDETWQISDNIFDKDGKYIISARPYKGKKQGPTTDIVIDFYENAPGVQDIQLNAESKSTFDESGIYTNNSTPGFLITVPDGDQQRVWKMQVLVIKKSDDNTLETIEIRDTLFPGNNTQPVNTQKSWSKGTYEIVVTLTDKAGNPSTQKTQTIYFDDTKPKPVIHFHPEASPDKSGEKNIIKNQNRKFVIKGTEEKRIEASDEIEVTLTQINKTSSKETLYHSKKDATLFSYNEGKKEQTFSLGKSDAWPKGDFKLNVKVTDRYGNTGISKEPLSFTIQDSVHKPEIGLIDDDDTSYHKKTDVHITNKPKPRFSLTNLDEHATRVDIKTTPPVVGATQLKDTFDDLAGDNNKKEELKNSFQLRNQWSKNGDYKLSVNTFVDAEPSPETTLTVLFDDQLKQPQITLDEETRKSSSASESGATVASQTPKFNLLDIEDDVKHILLQVYKGDHKTLVETIKFDIKDLGDTDKTKNIEEKGIKRTDSGYTYQPSEWEDKTKYKISLTVTDRAKNSNETTPAEFEVNIDTAIAKIPSITLDETDNQASDKIKKFITKNQNPSFQLGNIDDRAETITITIYKTGSAEALASKILNKEEKTFKIDSLSFNGKNPAFLEDGQYTIQAKVTLNTKVSSTSGTLVFTVDHAEAPTPTIELVGNTGTIQKPVTNKTSPKFKIKNIALDRLDWDNHDSIVVTFQKKNPETKEEPVTQQLTNSDIQKDNNAVEFTANQLEQGEYTVTAKVTYQAGQVGSGSLNKSDGMTIYTQPPQSRIEFENTEKVRTEGGKNKVQKQDLKFKISVNDDTAMLKKGSSKVKVSLKKGDVKEGPEIEALYNNTENVWKVDLSDNKSISKGDYTIEANVTDKHDNTGTSQMSFYMLDGLLKPEIEIETNDHTPYDPTEYKDNKKITNKTQPTFIIKNIDPEAESVTFSVSKKGVEIPFATRNYKKNEGGWLFSGNTEKIKVEFKDDGDYEIKLDVVGVGGVQQSAKALLLTFNAQVDPPRISLESQKDVAKPLTSEKKPTFLIQDIGEHVREIKIIRESQDKNPVKKEFICKINDKGEVQNLNNDFGGRLTKDTGNTGTYRFTPSDDWPDGTYNVRVEVTNRAKKSAMSNEDNIITLTIDNNLPEVPTIELEPAHNSTYPVSLKQTETWTQNNSPKFNITVKRNDVNPVTKVHVKVKDPRGNENIEEATQKEGKWTFTPGTPFTKGAYTLSVQSENKLGRTSHFSSDITVNFNSVPPVKPGIRLDSESITGIDNPTDITNKPSPKLSITNINTIQDAVDPDAVEVTLINDSKNQALATNAIARYDSTNNTFFYVQRNLSEGNYTATVKATNKAGIPSEISAPLKFKIDTTPPEKPTIELTTESFIDHSSSGVRKKVAKDPNQLVFLIKTAAEIKDEKYIEVSLDGNTLNKSGVNMESKRGVLSLIGAYSKNVWEFTYNIPLSAKDDYQLSVKIEDKAGNSASTTSELFRVLPGLPTPTIEMANSTSLDKANYPNLTKNNEVLFNITLPGFKAQDVKEVKVKVNDQRWKIINNEGTGTWKYRTDSLTDNKHTLSVQVTDITDKNKTAEQNFVVDTTISQPVIQMVRTEKDETTPEGKTIFKRRKPSFKFTSIPEDIYEITVTLDNDQKTVIGKSEILKNSQSNTYTWTPPADLSRGEHTIKVAYRDLANNEQHSQEQSFGISVLNVTYAVLPPETDAESDDLRSLRNKDPREYGTKNFAIHIIVEGKTGETFIVKDIYEGEISTSTSRLNDKFLKIKTDKFNSGLFKIYSKDGEKETFLDTYRIPPAPNNIKWNFFNKGGHEILAVKGNIEPGMRLIIGQKKKKIASTDFLKDGEFHVEIDPSRIQDFKDLVIFSEDAKGTQSYLAGVNEENWQNRSNILFWDEDKQSYVLKNDQYWHNIPISQIDLVNNYTSLGRYSKLRAVDDYTLTFSDPDEIESITQNLNSGYFADKKREDSSVPRNGLSIDYVIGERGSLSTNISGFVFFNRKDYEDNFKDSSNKNAITYYDPQPDIGVPKTPESAARSKRSLPLEEESAKEGKDENLPEPTPIASKAQESHQPHTREDNREDNKEAQAQEGNAQLIQPEVPQAIEADALKKESFPLLQPVDFNAPATAEHPDSELSPEAKAEDTPAKEQALKTSDAPLPPAAIEELDEKDNAEPPQNPIELLNPITSEENTTADLTPSFTLNAPKEAPDAVKALVTLDNRPEYALELIDNQGVFTVEMPLAEGPHQLKVKFIDPDGDWIRLDKTFTIDASSERILSSLETPDRYQIDLSTGSKTSPSKENADILMMTPVLHLPEHEEESIYYG